MSAVTFFKFLKKIYLLYIVTGREADRKQGKREGNDVQHRSLVGFEPGTLRLGGMHSNQLATRALQL